MEGTRGGGSWTAGGGGGGTEWMRERHTGKGRGQVREEGEPDIEMGVIKSYSPFVFIQEGEKG